MIIASARFSEGAAGITPSSSGCSLEGTDVGPGVLKPNSPGAFACDGQDHLISESLSNALSNAPANALSIDISRDVSKALSQSHPPASPYRPTVARFFVGGRQPRLTEALMLGERIHAALVELSDGASIFTGCDRSGRPLQGHPHAYVLSESGESGAGPGQGPGGAITHVTVYASSGFGPREALALEELREVWGHDIQVRLRLQGLGRPEDFGSPEAGESHSPLLACSRTWVSRTPFLPTRHPKLTRAGAPKLDDAGLQIGSPEHELRRLLGLAGFPQPVAVEPVSWTVAGERKLPWHAFLRRRERGEGRRAANGAGYGFRIEFPEAVHGPVAVGYGAHFGMGGFEGANILL